MIAEIVTIYILIGLLHAVLCSKGASDLGRPPLSLKCMIMATLDWPIVMIPTFAACFIWFVNVKIFRKEPPQINRFEQLYSELQEFEEEHKDE